MAKSSKAAPTKDKKQKDVLSTVKAGGITKAVEAPKAKAKEIAKKIAPNLMAKDSKKDNKPSKKKAATPESESDSEEEDSSDASDSESEASSSESEDEKPVSKAKAAPAPKTNGKVAKKDESDSSDDSSEDDSEDEEEAKPAAQDDSDDSSSDSSDEEEEKEAPKAAAAKVNGAVVNGKAKEASSDESSSEEEDSDDSDDSSDEEAAKPVSKTKAEPAAAKKAEDSDDSEDDSEDDSSDSDSSSDEEEEKPKATDSKKRKADTEESAPTKKNKTVEVAANATKTLFVGQLSWNVDDDWLRREFEGYNVENARVMWDNQKDRSKGFAYVDFASVEDAQKALNEKQGMEIDGRGVNLDFSQPRQQQNNATDRAKRFGDSQSPPTDTLFVGNMSFQCDENTLGEAFAAHGEVISVRIPTDRDTGNKKGFAYVTFSSIDEAKAANSAMNGQVIAGRPIRTDFSQPRDNSSGGGQRGGRGGGGFGGGRGRGGPGGRGGRGGAPRGGRGGFNSNRTPVAMGKKMTFDD